MKVYAGLLRVPGVLTLVASQTFARLPLGMLSLAVLLHVQAKTGSYALAGAVVACVSIGEALAMPLTARIAGKLGRATTLMAAAMVNGCALVALSLAGSAPVAQLLLGVAIGASVPPLAPVVRALYPYVVSGPSLRALFALDTTAQEVCWVVGPLVATMLASTLSTALPLVVAGAVTVVGTAWFLFSARHVRPAPRRSSAAFGRILGNGAVALAIAASLPLIASFTALEVGVVARYGTGSLMTGAAIAVASLGSLVGGIMFGHRRFGVRGLAAALATVAAGTALFGVVGQHGLQLAVLFASGLGFAPALATLYLMVSRAVDENASAEAFGWLNSGALAGGAIGTATAGVVTDAHGFAGAVVVSVVLAAVAALSPLVARARGPVRGLGDTAHEDELASCAA
ncbi:MFS transporter [Mycolicibacterium sp. J2]|uniref:MFS transporter n=1 Tax=Mycolicibacterium sp. J2 TaxID=2993511 RepID=UPI00224B639D|nr:MFS transporter [Mycolicibacterium sp. J2]MCX2711709.1 MFS transporter [Mycolicibacterium sp. J2]